MKINSGDENIEIVGESERVMGVGGCEGIEISVCKLEREYEQLFCGNGAEGKFSPGLL